MLEVLEEVAQLSDEDVDKFKRVLEKTTLEQIIKLSDEVSQRLVFLSMLHEMVYGDLSKKLKERSQLHKILDQHKWLFGDKFHLATSDKSFRKIVERHRKEIGLPAVDWDKVEKVSNFKDIPDLFFVSTRTFPFAPRHHHLIVELKAPSKSIGPKEIAQARKYAKVIGESAEFDKSQTKWDIYLISSEISGEVEFELTQTDRDYGHVHKSGNINIWVLRWSTIIERAKSEMALVEQLLKTKTEELSVSEYLRTEFPFLVPAESLP